MIGMLPQFRRCGCCDLGECMPSDVNSAEIVIRRESAFPGAAVAWTVLIDGQKVGTLRNGSSLTVHSAPGRHTLVVGPPSVLIGTRSAPFSFEAGAGERIELAGQATMWRPRIWRPDVSSSPPSLFADLAGQAAMWRRKNWDPSVPPSSPIHGEPEATVSRPPTTSTIIEGSRYEVHLGNETRTIDNSKSASSTTRVVRLAREWTRTCAVDTEHITTEHGSAGLGIHVLDLKVEAERTLSRTYSTTTEKRETYSEEVTLNIAEHTKSEIVFYWKEIHQKGIVQVVGVGFEARIPYEVVVGLTFDQQQVDAL
jgi:hypothetical protein